MIARRRAATAEERLATLEREQARLRRERLIREVGGARWQRLVRVIPLLFERQGVLIARRLRESPEAVIEALRGEAVFALDTALRLSRGYGFLASGDIHAYLLEGDILDRLAERGLIAREPYPDTVLLRPWPGPPRLLACRVDTLPEHVTLASGHRVVTPERLARELVGAVGPRADLFALVE
jgi:hypothetical protein